MISSPSGARSSIRFLIDDILVLMCLIVIIINCKTLSPLLIKSNLYIIYYLIDINRAAEKASLVIEKIATDVKNMKSHKLGLRLNNLSVVLYFALIKDTQTYIH